MQPSDNLDYFLVSFENRNSVAISRHQMYCAQKSRFTISGEIKANEDFVGFIFTPKQVFPIFHKLGLQGHESVKALKVVPAHCVCGTPYGHCLVRLTCKVPGFISILKMRKLRASNSHRHTENW